MAVQEPFPSLPRLLSGDIGLDARQLGVMIFSCYAEAAREHVYEDSVAELLTTTVPLWRVSVARSLTRELLVSPEMLICGDLIPTKKPS